MTTTHFRDTHGRPVGLDDVDTIDELAEAVISGTFEHQWVVEISGGGATCRTCDHNCDHADSVERALREHDLLGGDA